MTTTTIIMPKVETKDTETGIIKSLRNAVVTVPKNVIDVQYFKQAVQFNIFDIAMCNATTALNNINQKLATMKAEGKDDTNAYMKAQDNRNDLIKLISLLSEAIRNFDDELTEEYENISDIKTVFLTDTFAKTYAWALGHYDAKKVWKNGNEANKGKVEEIRFHFSDESKIIGCLKDFDLSTTQEQKKNSAKQIEVLANNLFATPGGEVYKNISYKFTAEKVNKNLYTRFKKLYDFDTKTGNIKDLENTAYDMCKQLFFMCLLQLGVATIDGQKIVKVEEIEANKEPVKINRKKKVQVNINKK